jgi:hypothetical protein
LFLSSGAGIDVERGRESLKKAEQHKITGKTAKYYHFVVRENSLAGRCILTQTVGIKTIWKKEIFSS